MNIRDSDLQTTNLPWVPTASWSKIGALKEVVCYAGSARCKGQTPAEFGRLNAARFEFLVQ
jgi:hypothetical protein